jgi:hypothetical protein
MQKHLCNRIEMRARGLGFAPDIETRRDLMWGSIIHTSHDVNEINMENQKK